MPTIDHVFYLFKRLDQPRVSDDEEAYVESLMFYHVTKKTCRILCYLCQS